MKHALFVGRYVPVHNGHIGIWREKIDAGIPVCIAIRLTTGEAIEPVDRAELIRKAMTCAGYTETVDFLIIFVPDIESICYSRHVGYALEELGAPQAHISATEIREIAATGATPPHVPLSIVDDLVELLSPAKTQP